MSAKETYIVATPEEVRLEEQAIREAFESEEVSVDIEPWGFVVRSESSTVNVRFDPRLEPLGWTPDLLTGTPELKQTVAHARGFYRVSFEYGRPAPSVAVFEALWTVRMLMELIEQGVAIDVVAFKLHSRQDVEEITELDFDIRDHLTIHATELSEKGKMWVHTHGLAKFAVPEVELFLIEEDDLPAAETFLHELCTDLAFGSGPRVRQVIATSVGRAFTLVPAEEGRSRLFPQVDPESLEGHGSGFLTVVTDEGKHAMGDILGQYRDRFEEESEAETSALQSRADRLLPAFKARFQRRGLMEPLQFQVRAPFEVHPDGADAAPEEEHLWVEVVAWEQGSLIGRLVDGGQLTTEWRKGSHVEVEDTQINALTLTREGKPLDPEEMEKLLSAERPA